MTDDNPECVCEGNWRKIVNEYAPYIGKKFVRDGEDYVFSGLLWGDDDYYYNMWNINAQAPILCSCVGSLEMFGFELEENQ